MRGREGGCSSMDENRLHLPLCGQECQDVHAFLQYVLLRIYAFVCVCKLTFFKRTQVVNIHIKHSGLNCDMRECISIKTSSTFLLIFSGRYFSILVCLYASSSMHSILRFLSFFLNFSLFLSSLRLSPFCFPVFVSLSLSYLKNRRAILKFSEFLLKIMLVSFNS